MLMDVHGEPMWVLDPALSYTPFPELTTVLLRAGLQEGSPAWEAAICILSNFQAANDLGYPLLIPDSQKSLDAVPSTQKKEFWNYATIREAAVALEMEGAIEQTGWGADTSAT